MQYRTQQRDTIVRFIEGTAGRHFTVEDVRAHLAEAGFPVGIATIYRHIERLVAEGTVAKYDTGAGGAACFEWTGGGCADGEHFHLKCEGCGALIHLECGELSLIASHLLASHGFRLNPLRTVFHGLCASCAAAQNPAEQAEIPPPLPETK